MTVQDFMDGLTHARLVAIIRGPNEDAAVEAAATILGEGFRFLEISLITRNALEVISRVARDAPPDAWIGAGTVRTAEDVRRVREAGGTFAVTPVVSMPVLHEAGAEFPVIAGALTPTESWTAMESGACAVKLFPASLGGPPYLKALREPLPDVPFVPVGGVRIEQVDDYFDAGAIAVGLGSPLLGDAAAGGDLGELRGRARGFLDAAESWKARLS